MAELTDAMRQARALLREGRALMAQKHLDEAVAKCQAAAELDPADIGPLVTMQQCLTELDRHEEAIAVAQKSVEISPDDQFAYMSLSRAYQRSGKIPEAEYAMMQGQQAAMRAGR